MNFPRVLVVAPIQFNLQAGGGVTMGNLFRGWPLNAIAQIHSYNSTEPDRSVCTNYLSIPPLPIPKRPRRSEAIELLSLATGRLDYLIPLENILQWTRQFAPDVIYTRPVDQPKFYWWLPQWLAHQLGIPYVTHIMDDWPARYNYQQGWRNNLFWKPMLRRSLQMLLDRAAVNIGISSEMCQAYQKRYQCEFVPFHNCIDVSQWSNCSKSYQTENEFCLLYLGAVTEDKELGSLLDIREAILSLRQQGYAVRLVIYSAPQWKSIVQQRLEHLPDIVYAGYVHPSELPKVLSQADLLVLPINFDKISQTYVGYSLQTKVPEYMASGTPVLVYGPPNSPNVRYAKREGWGLVVEQQDQEQLKQAIIELIEKPELQSKLGQHARKLAFQNHDATAIRNKFRQLMYNVACGVYN